MFEIRVHGRGGQGAVTAAQLLAIAAFYDGKYAQAFPIFGVERRGAPSTSFVRIDDKPINLRSQIYEPDYVIVLDPTLVEIIDVKQGLKKDLIVNCSEHKIKDAYCINASEIALEIFGKPILNTVILGAFAKISKIISLESIEKAIEQKFEGKKGLIELNKIAVRRAYEQAKN